ncbi:hypothetical protein BGZ83_009587 [Gryganskiella cystojenkinii]|nr:hypothetical protein BGZ83_009587 [Gryganskiella cystojenkinii]
MELLPLEGPLLSRLEILVVDTGTWGYLEVNTFLDRISQSCVAKSLVKLIILDFTNISLRGLENSPGKVKWDSLRNCILALRALKLFSYKNFEIEIEGLASESNVEAIVAKMTSPAVISTYPTSTALVSNVKSLKLTSLPASLDVSQALWMLVAATALSIRFDTRVTVRVASVDEDPEGLKAGVLSRLPRTTGE